MSMRRMAIEKSPLKMYVFRFPTSCLARGGGWRSRKGGWGQGASITAWAASEARNARLKRYVSAGKGASLSERPAPHEEAFARTSQGHGGRVLTRGPRLVDV